MDAKSPDFPISQFPNYPPFGRRLKVLHLITRMIVGGAEWNTLYTVRLLDRQRYEPMLACGSQTGAEGNLLELEPAKTSGVPVWIIPNLIRKPDPLRDLKALKELVRLFKEIRPDILHTHESKAGVLGRLAGRLAKVPCIVHTVHGFSFLAPIPKWQRRLYLFLERKAGRWCDALIFISVPLMEEARRQGIGDPDCYAYIPSGIDLKAFNGVTGAAEKPAELVAAINGKPVIGTVGRITKEKGFEVLLHAAHRLKREGLLFHLVWVGDGPERKAMEALARRLGLADWLLVTGVRDDVPRWVRGFDIFALPTLWEGMGRVFLEAQAAGVPVVGTKVGGVPDVVVEGQTGFLVPPGDVEAFAEALKCLLIDPILRQRMGRAGRQFVDERFSVERMVKAIEEVYEQTWQRCQGAPLSAARESRPPN